MSTLTPHDQSPIKGYDHNDPTLKTGAGGLTVWDLQKMAQEKRIRDLDDMFDNGLTMNSLPAGISAGVGVATLHTDIKLVNDWLSIFADKNWRAKYSSRRTIREFLKAENRMRSSFLRSSAPFVPMMKFTTKLLDSH